MKKIAVLLSIFSIGGMYAQTTSKRVETYKRYENGKLVEERNHAEENGVPIENFDFENGIDEFMQSSPSGSSLDVDFSDRMESMQARMKEMQTKAERMMETKMAEMNQRMEELQQRATRMQLDMEKRMDEQRIEMQKRQSQPPSTPSQSPTPQKTQVQSGTHFT